MTWKSFQRETVHTAHRLARSARRLHEGAPDWLANVVLYLGIGVFCLTIGVWWGAREDAPRPAGIRAAPDTTPQAAQVAQVAPTPAVPESVIVVRDWADTVDIPVWVLDSDEPQDGSAKAYERLSGGEAARQQTGSVQRRPVPVPGTGSAPQVADLPAPDAGARSPILVRRVSGVRMEAVSLGMGDGSELRSGMWRVPGECDVALSLHTSQGNRLRGEQAGRTGEWIFSLAVPESSCAGAGELAVRRLAATSREREALALATGASPVIRQLGAPTFGPGDLRDLAVRQDGEVTWAWGVFRQSARTTQVYPPPPLPQIAFVARTADGASWDILWAKYSESSAETIGLAGVYDANSDGAFEAFFGIRSTTGISRVLRVSPRGGAWGVTDTVELPA